VTAPDDPVAASNGRPYRERSALAFLRWASVRLMLRRLSNAE